MWFTVLWKKVSTGSVVVLIASFNVPLNNRNSTGKSSQNIFEK